MRATGPARSPTPDAITSSTTWSTPAGALAIQALRNQIGDTDFFALLKAWPAAHRYGNASTADFIAFTEALTGKNLDSFFHTWLYSPGQPPLQ